jgi:hypothetical protein
MPGRDHELACCCERCPAVHAQRLQALNAMHARLTVWTAWLAGAAIVVCAAEVVGKTLLA